MKRRALDEIAARQREASGEAARLQHERESINLALDHYYGSALPRAALDAARQIPTIAISDFVLLFFRGDCPSVATPQSQVGVIIPAALVL